eukprot:TRINITY_DN3797_c0_g1_i1.p1 TRINITY_DN3797_c0_g1~~TRINITY_DN3797_c0_g1_i1.p1  ORF type:complete len:649 (+),score=143.61 TRINITY_DN3797_c0_g1_i1:74-2020(+)
MPEEEWEPVFRTPVEKLKRKDDDSIPYVIDKFITVLRNHVNVEGIFRISGKQEDIERLKKEFDTHDVNVSESPPHLVTGLFKLFLRHMPEPLLFPPKAYMAVHSENNDTLREYRYFHLFYSLPRLNQLIIRAIFSLLYDVSKSESSLMGISNLALIFGPILLPVDPSVTSLDRINAHYSDANQVMSEFLELAVEFLAVKDFEALIETHARERDHKRRLEHWKCWVALLSKSAKHPEISSALAEIINRAPVTEIIVDSILDDFPRDEESLYALCQLAPFLLRGEVSEPVVEALRIFAGMQLDSQTRERVIRHVTVFDKKRFMIGRAAESEANSRSVAYVQAKFEWSKRKMERKSKRKEREKLNESREPEPKEKQKENEEEDWKDREEEFRLLDNLLGLGEAMRRTVETETCARRAALIGQTEFLEELSDLLSLKTPCPSIEIGKQIPATVFDKIGQPTLLGPIISLSTAQPTSPFSSSSASSSLVNPPSFSLSSSTSSTSWSPPATLNSSSSPLIIASSSSLASLSNLVPQSLSVSSNAMAVTSPKPCTEDEEESLMTSRAWDDDDDEGEEEEEEDLSAAQMAELIKVEEIELEKEKEEREKREKIEKEKREQEERERREREGEKGKESEKDKLSSSSEKDKKKKRISV